MFTWANLVSQMFNGLVLGATTIGVAAAPIVFGGLSDLLSWQQACMLMGILTALVTCELAGLLALLTRDEGLRTERRRIELRTLSTELRTRSGVRRTRCAETATAPSAAAAAAPAPRAILIAELWRRRSRLVRTGCRVWAGGARRFVRRFARGFVTALPRPLVLSAL